MSLDYQDMINSLLLFHNYLKMEDEKVFDDFLKITDNLNRQKSATEYQSRIHTQ